MATLPAEDIERFSELHRKPEHLIFQYGTAGFRTLGETLESALFRVGILAALRSKHLGGKTIGIMITASHNPEPDNGVKLVDPRGEMLEASWESHATALANAATTQELILKIQSLVSQLRIDLSKPANVVYARDTRPSGPTLVSALQDGLKAMAANGRDEGLQTTPMLHYLVRCINTKGTASSYGNDSLDGYYSKLVEAFKKLVTGKQVVSPLLVDCANGIGAQAAREIATRLAGTITIVACNDDTTTPGSLNKDCGADFVKTMQKAPTSMLSQLRPGQRACSLDGDADRLMYYYLDERGHFRMLDGDKISTLVASFLKELVQLSGLKLEVGVIQTAYANGSSTKYLSQRVPVRCVPTGVKHLHHAAERFSIGVYFEANGHGTVLFSPSALEQLDSYEPSTPAQATALGHLRNINALINQTVGDAISDMLLVEVILAHQGYQGAEWDSLYHDLPNKLVKVVVRDRNVFKTEDAERRLVSPPGLQNKIDELVQKYDGGRSFVRASGTEDAVRVYAEATIKAQADELAMKVASLVYEEAGGKS